MFEIRPLTSNDLTKSRALFIGTYPERAGEADEWRIDDTRAAGESWVATTPANVLVGCGRCWRVVGDRFRFDLIVDTSWRRQGIGSRLLQRLLEAAAARDGATLQARARSDWNESLQFLEHRGFIETMRMQASRLALDAVDPRVLTFEMVREQRLAAEGVHVTTFATEMQSDASCWTRLADLQAAAQAEWRDPDPRPDERPSRLDADELRRFYESLGFVPEAVFLAVTRDMDGVRYVGTAGVTPRADRPGEAWPQRTMVHPKFRGRGLAALLKARCIAWARENGYRELHSETGHPALQHINATLGFRVLWTEVRLVRPLKQADAQ